MIGHKNVYSTFNTTLQHIPVWMWKEACPWCWERAMMMLRTAIPELQKNRLCHVTDHSSDGDAEVAELLLGWLQPSSLLTHRETKVRDFHYYRATIAIPGYTNIWRYHKSVLIEFFNLKCRWTALTKWILMIPVTQIVISWRTMSIQTKRKDWQKIILDSPSTLECLYNKRWWRKCISSQ